MIGDVLFMSDERSGFGLESSILERKFVHRLLQVCRRYCSAAATRTLVDDCARMLL